jgi:hypothetical protein
MFNDVLFVYSHNIFERSLNIYLDKCLDIIAYFVEF